MYKIVIIAAWALTTVSPVFAQNSFYLDTLRLQNRLKAIEEAKNLKIEAAAYYYGGGVEKNKNRACLTIQQAYEVELSYGSSRPETRAAIRLYCS